MNIERNSITGSYYGGDYEYYEIESFQKCKLCKHFTDNTLNERFECDSKVCEYDEIDLWEE